MPRPVHFEIAADNLEQVALFYQRVFGWGLNWAREGMPYILATTGDPQSPGINGAFMRRSMPGQATINTIDVSSVDEFMNRVVQAGGTILAPKIEIPGIGFLAYCRDIEGNPFGILEPVRRP